MDKKTSKSNQSISQSMDTCTLTKTLLMALISCWLRVCFSLWVSSDSLQPMSRKEVFLHVRPGTQPLHPWQGNRVFFYSLSQMRCRRWRSSFADTWCRSWSWTFRPERLASGWRKTVTRRSRSSCPLLTLRRRTTVGFCDCWRGHDEELEYRVRNTFKETTQVEFVWLRDFIERASHQSFASPVRCCQSEGTFKISTFATVPHGSTAILAKCKVFR